MVVAGIQTGCRLLFVGFFLVDVFEKYRTIYEKKNAVLCRCLLFLSHGVK